MGAAEGVEDRVVLLAAFFALDAAIAPVFAGAFGFGVAFVEGVITVGPTSVCGLRTAPPSENPVVAPTREPAIPRTNWPG